MLQMLSIALLQIKLVNTSQKLLNKTRKILYFQFRSNNITKKYITNQLNQYKTEYKYDLI